MQEVDIVEKFKELDGLKPEKVINTKLAQHKLWLQTIEKEYPSPKTSFRIGVYIRYYNQTKYENYLEYHKRQYVDTIALCPKWSIQDFYIDEGMSAPHMESSPEWCRLLEDCLHGKIDLIITQKVSNISSDMEEMALCARLLAAMDPPIGIYIISEDIYTLASYYKKQLRDIEFLPGNDWQMLKD